MLLGDLCVVLHLARHLAPLQPSMHWPSKQLQEAMVEALCICMCCLCVRVWCAFGVSCVCFQIVWVVRPTWLSMVGACNANWWG